MEIFKKKIDSKKIALLVEKKHIYLRYFELILGILIVAIAYNLFFLPNDIVFGGVSGLAIIFNNLTNIDPAIFIFIASILLLIISFLVLGKDSTKGSIVGSLVFPIFVELTANINGVLNIDTTNILLCVIFGGVMYGFGAGMVFKAGFTTGGTDVISQILSKYLHISMGNSMLFSDGLIVLASAFIFGTTKLLYAIIVIYISGVLTDKVLLGISNKKAFYIITNNELEVKEYIIKEMKHSITIFNAKGGYTNEKENVLLCVVPTTEYYRIKEGIHEIDKDAFFVITDAYEVFGGE